ncbi:MAG TPA: hypothetical protein VH374_02600 [Polyangia bacterium]|nr:hypothetical protein [Polyangia bacterium]
MYNHSALTLARLRHAALPLALAMLAWTASCATAPAPLVEPAFAARTYTPARIALLPPDVFVILDQVGDNDPAASAALGQSLSAETVAAIQRLLHSRGYEVNLSARWDGVVAQDGQLLVSRDELGWLANGILQFENSPDSVGQGPLSPPRFVAPELAARVGWATQSDALLYVNVKGVSVSNGKRVAQVLGVVFVVVIVAAIIVATLAEAKGGGGSHAGPLGGGSGGGGWRGTPAFRGAPGGRGAAAAVAPSHLAAPTGGGWRAPVGRGAPPPVPGAPGRIYGGGPHVNIGVGLVIPLDGPQYTHEGTVAHDDEWFGGDNIYVAMTLVSAYDGRILWHTRQHLDLDAESAKDVDAMAATMLSGLPARIGTPDPAAPPASTPTGGR